MHKFIKELLGSEKVEWKKLEEVGEFVRGNGLTKKELTTEGIPAIHYGQIYTYYGTFCNETISFVTPETARKLKKVNYGDVIITNTSENIKDIGKAVAYFGKQQAITGGHATIFKPSEKILSMYFVYFTQSRLFEDQKLKAARGVKVYDVTANQMKEFIIPIPPINVQQKIIEILDQLLKNKIELVNSLNKEKELRLKQYAFYRDKLLGFGEEIPKKSLDEIFNISAGGDVPKNALSPVKTEEFNIPILSNGIKENALYGWTNIPKIMKPSLTVSARGTIGWTSYQEKPFYPIVRLLILTPKIKINLKYAYYFMQMIENDYIIPLGGIPQLTKAMVKNIKIPLPSLEEQQRIVNILEPLDKLTNDITEGLPREIELREKQYQFYRDLLLDFTDKEY